MIFKIQNPLNGYGMSGAQNSKPLDAVISAIIRRGKKWFPIYGHLRNLKNLKPCGCSPKTLLYGEGIEIMPWPSQVHGRRSPLPKSSQFLTWKVLRSGRTVQYAFLTKWLWGDVFPGSWNCGSWKICLGGASWHAVVCLGHGVQTNLLEKSCSFLMRCCNLETYPSCVPFSWPPKLKVLLSRSF